MVFWAPNRPLGRALKAVPDSLHNLRQDFRSRGIEFTCLINATDSGSMLQNAFQIKVNHDKKRFRDSAGIDHSRVNQALNG
jgi:hypothetical protein